MAILFIATIIILFMTIRSLLMVLGMYKDPVLASLENYGQERIFSPMFNFIVWTLVLLYILLFWYLSAGVVLAVGLTISVPIASLKDNVQRILDENPNFFRSFPRWYYQLIQMSDREERRRIAYLWLRLPLQTRMIYNAHHALFQQWVEQVILTVS